VIGPLLALIAAGALGAQTPAVIGVSLEPAAAGEIWKVDQIRFPMPKDLSVIKQLTGLHSLDAIAERLKKLGIKFDRGPMMLDTTRAPKKMIDSINASPPSDPWFAPTADTVTINVVVSRSPAVRASGTQSR
jgi:hypothetical protein